MPCYTFGPFSLDPEARILLCDGEPLPVSGKALDVLVVLVQNRGRLVDKDELLSRFWAGTIVEEANLTQSIFTVRKILGDSPKPRYSARRPRPPSRGKQSRIMRRSTSSCKSHTSRYNCSGRNTGRQTLTATATAASASCISGGAASRT